QIITEHDGLMIPPLGVTATPFLGDRAPIGAGFLLERRPRLLILLQQAAVIGDRRLRGHLRHRVRQHARLHGAAPRRDQQQSEREASNAKLSKPETNRLRAHDLVVASAKPKSAPNGENVRRRSDGPYFQANTGCSSSATRVFRPASTSWN